MTNKYHLAKWQNVSIGETPLDEIQHTLNAYNRTADGHQLSKIVDDYVDTIRSLMPTGWDIVGGWHRVHISYTASEPMVHQQHVRAVAKLRHIIRDIDVRYFIEKHTKAA